jgi:hypothetical protein
MSKSKLLFDEAADAAVARMREQMKRLVLEQVIAEARANIRQQADELCGRLRAVAAGPLT